MNTLSVWRFEDPAGAERAADLLGGLAQSRLVAVDDAALLAWWPGRRNPHLRDLGSFTGPGVLWNGFWGMLLGLMFLAPAAGLALGAGAAAVVGSLNEFGIDDRFVQLVRDRVRPGTSALFVFSDGAQIATLDRAIGADLVRTRLTEEQAWRLGAALTEDCGTSMP
jgi:uncharacterized membrane protein